MTTVAEVQETAETAVPSAQPGAAEAVAARSHRTRADAVRNRERIVSAARDVFVEYGPDAPLDEIARRAGIGNATLYRHFADRRTLGQAVLLYVLTRTADRAEAEAADVAAGGDPCAALSRFAHTAVEENVGALCGLLVNGHEGRPPELTEQKARLEAALDALMERARRDGRLRADVTRTDLLVAISRLTRPLPGVDCPGSDVHRHLQLFLDGLKAPAPTPAPTDHTAPAPVPGPTDHKADDATARTP